MLNRSERRRLAKHGNIAGKIPTMTFNDYTYYHGLAFADALYCSFDMNAEQIKEVFNKVKMTMECLKEGRISLDDIETMCEEELGMKFVKSLK